MLSEATEVRSEAQLSAPRTESAISKMREMIVGGHLSPGSRLPPEAELAAAVGASRNTVREAVRALVTAGVLDVRRGDGTYVTSLRPELLLEGVTAAVELMHEGFSLELVAVRRILEPAAARLAATNMDDATLAELEALLFKLDEAPTQPERTPFDSAFHALVASRSGNATLTSMLAAVSTRTMRAKAWRVIDEQEATRSAAQHREILDALRARDPDRAEAAVHIHVATTEERFRHAQRDEEDGVLQELADRPVA
jgi:GntR family transcriptional regulator, transcriptional repressor for pyruvate dehydrogenase complex